MILLIDNYDSFTYNLVDYFKQLGVSCKVIRNNTAFSKIKEYEPEGIVLSPGPEIPRKSGNLLKVIDHWYKNVPFLGVCLGHQALGEYFGMSLIKASVPRHGKLTQINHNGDLLFRGLPPQFNVVQYNSLILQPTGNSKVLVIAYGKNNEVMAIKHKEYPLYGMQFHPEAALTEHGLALLKNWLVSNNLSR